MGLKCKYSDVYDVYTEDKNKKNDNEIEKFKDFLRKDSPKYEKWSDFEWSIGQNAKCFNSDREFIKCVRDFRSFMVEHLQNEQKIF